MGIRKDEKTVFGRIVRSFVFVLCALSAALVYVNWQSDVDISRAIRMKSQVRRVMVLDETTLECVFFKSLAMWDAGMTDTTLPAVVREKLMSIAYRNFSDINKRAPGYKNIGLVIEKVERYIKDVRS